MALNTDWFFGVLCLQPTKYTVQPLLSIFFFMSMYVCISLFNINVNIFLRMASYLMRLAFAISKWLCSLSCLFQTYSLLSFFPGALIKTDCCCCIIRTNL